MDQIVDLQFGSRKVPEPFVEIRSVVEWDGLIEALFSSASFRERLASLSLMVTISAMELNGPGSGALADPVLETVFYFVCDRHLEDFVSAVLPTKLDAGFELAVACALIQSSLQVVQYGNVAQLMWDMLIPVRVSTRRARGEMSTSGKVSQQLLLESDPATKARMGLLAEELRVLDEKKRLLQEQIARGESTFQADPTLPDAGSPQKAIETARRELMQLGKVHDELERKFTAMARRLSEEREAVKELDVELSRLRSKLDEEESMKKHLTDDKTTLTTQASSLSLDRDRLFAEVKAKEEAVASADKEDRELGRLFEDARREELRREETGLQEAQEQAIAAIAKATQAARDHVSETEQHLARQLRALEDRRETAQSVVVDETRKRDETSARVVGLKSKLIGLSQEVNLMEKSLASAKSKEESFRAKTPTVALTHDGLLKLQLQQTAAESALSSALEERASAKKVLTELQRLLDVDGNKAAQAEKEAKDAHGLLFPRYKAQLELMMRTLQQLEASYRRVLEHEGLAALEQLRAQEAHEWRSQLNKAEKYFHEEEHLAKRRELHSIDRDTTSILTRTAAVRTQNESYESKFKICDESHRMVMADAKRQLDELREEELVLRDGLSREDDVLKVLEAEQEVVKKRCQTLRSCLAQAPIDASRNRSGGVEAVKHSRVLPSAVDLIERLTRLCGNAEGRLEIAQIEQLNIERKTQRLEREMEERTAIAKKLRSGISEAETEIQKLEDTIAERKIAVEDRNESHTLLRQQLKEEYVLAQEMLARHKTESATEVSALSSQLENLQEILSRTERELKSLRQQRDTFRRRNTETNEATLRLQIHREKVKQEQLRSEIAALTN